MVFVQEWVPGRDEYRAASASDRQRRKDIAEQTFKELEIHTKIEEEVFYPAIRTQARDLEGLVAESYREHQTVDSVIGELRAPDPDREEYDAKFSTLIGDVKHHVDEEENEMFPKVRQELNEQMESLGGQMLARKEQFQMAMRRWMAWR